MSRRLSKYLKHKTDDKDKEVPKVEDIHIDADVLSDMSMEQVIKIAFKATKPGSTITPIDRMVTFL